MQQQLKITARRRIRAGQFKYSPDLSVEQSKGEFTAVPPANRRQIRPRFCRKNRETQSRPKAWETLGLLPRGKAAQWPDLPVQDLNGGLLYRRGLGGREVEDREGRGSCGLDALSFFLFLSLGFSSDRRGALCMPPGVFIGMATCGGLQPVAQGYLTGYRPSAKPRSHGEG